MSPPMASGREDWQPQQASDTQEPGQQRTGSRSARPQLPATESAFHSRSHVVNFNEPPRSPTSASTEGPLSPSMADRVFPIRSVVSVDPTPTPASSASRGDTSYFPITPAARRTSGTGTELAQDHTPGRSRRGSEVHTSPPRGYAAAERQSRQSTWATTSDPPQRRAQYNLNDAIAETESIASEKGDVSGPPSERPPSARAPSLKSTDEGPTLMTARFKHVVTESGHAVITGRDGEKLQRCEDEPIHIPGAIQGFGLLIALEEQAEGKLIVRVVSENSKQLTGYTPAQLFALESFTDILSEEQADNLLDHIDFIREEDADVVTNGPEVFTMTIRNSQRKGQKFWCAMHVNDSQKDLIVCEFELEDDMTNPLVAPGEATPELPEDTLNSQPTEEEYQESTQNLSRPLRVLRSARKRKGEAAAMEVFNIMAQVQEQLAAAPNLEKFLKVLVGVVKELTGFHRVMIYQFDQAWNGRVVTELVDPRATTDFYKGLNFPASDIPKQARDLYKINKVRMLYDRSQETARLVCRTMEDLERPLDLTHAYLRAMSPIHLKYLANMAVRSSMSISINAFDELWGLIACHTYGPRGMRVSFPIRKMCRLVGDSASRNIERLSYASRLQARKLINTVPTQSNPSGYIIASSEDLLKLFDADFGLLSIRDETKILGKLEHSQEALAMLEYFRLRQISSVMTSQDIRLDFPDLRYPPGFTVIAGLLLVPLSSGGQDFIVFFRKGQLREVKWAGNPYEKSIREGTEAFLEPRKSFRTWTENVVGKCREWTEEEIETAAVLCLVYGKFIEVWRQKEAALQNSQLTRLLLANSAHEVRTPLNAIINYLEIALEGSLDQETRDNLAKSHSASKSLIYVINDLLDLTKTEEGGELVKDDVFDPRDTLAEATEMFRGDAKRKGITYEVLHLPGLPAHVIGDARRVRQAISNVTANAIQNTSEGSVRVEMSMVRREGQKCDIEISVADTGIGMNSKKLDQLFRELEQVQSEDEALSTDNIVPDAKALAEGPKKEEGKALGLGLAVVARIIKNVNGQLRLKSEEGKGSRFVIQFPFDIPKAESHQQALEEAASTGSATPQAKPAFGPETPPLEGEVTLIERGSSLRTRSLDGKSNALMSRKNSSESVNSKRSVGSMKSAQSNLSYSSARSGKSEVDRLIEAIQEPHRVDGWHGDNPRRSASFNKGITGGRGSSASTPGASQMSLDRSHMHDVSSTASTGSPVGPYRTRSVDVADFSSNAPMSLTQTERAYPHPGESFVTDQGQPIRPVRIMGDAVMSPEDEPASLSYPSPRTLPSSADPFVSAAPSEADSAENMKVLVAEDDPVNSRIIEKRLSKLGHDVSLTVNGEDCSFAYCDRSDSFDIILMDMQVSAARE